MVDYKVLSRWTNHRQPKHDLHRLSLENRFRMLVKEHATKAGVRKAEGGRNLEHRIACRPVERRR
jgi:hypothetical protein